MKLQEKTAIIFILLLIGLLIICSVFISTITLSSYASLEKQYISKDLNTATNKIREEGTTLSAIVSDWGPWDDSYNYVLGKKPDFIETNIQPDTYNNLRLNLIVITDRNGSIVYSGAFDLESRALVPVPDSLVSQLKTENPLLNMTDPRHATTGILMLSDHPMIIASRPIVHTDFSGTPEGVVIMGRYLDETEVQRLSGLTQLNLTIYRADESLPDPGLVSRIRDRGGAPVLIEAVSPDEITGYALIPDLYGADAVVLAITESRDIYRQGLNTTYTFILIILGTGLLFGIIVILILDRLVLSRMSDLNIQVYRIGRDSTVTSRIELGGNDEFAGLAAQINIMLDTLEKTQQGFQASELRFRELSDLLPQIVFEMDLAGNLLYVNKAGVDQFGIKEEIIAQGTNIRDYISPSHIEQMKQGLAAVMAGGKSPGQTYSLKRHDGSAMKALVTTSLIHRDGKISGFRGVVVDITERTRLREQIEESSKLLSGILQASPVGVFQLDPSGLVIFVNATFSKITGISSADIQGKYWADILEPGEKQRVLSELGEAIRARKMTGSETRFIRADGSEIWLFGQTVPLIDSAGTLNGWVGTVTDITTRKKMEDDLKESEEKYRALTENTGDILFSTDMTGFVTYVSPQVNRYGYLVDEVVGRPLHTFIHPEDLDQVERNLSRELEKGAQFISTFRILDKWGNLHWFEEKSSLRLDQSGKSLGIYGILRDVSDRKRAEDAIELANKKLNLMNNITRHDILNTITGVYGYLDMAKATASPLERVQLMEDIRDLVKIIQRQINFTKEYQEVGVHLPRWQNINEVIERAVGNFEKSGIQFVIELEKIEIYADPLLEKVFYNLVDNAIRYGQTLRQITISVTISDKGLTLSFEDNGVGIEISEKRRIFERGVGKNTGMGLFLTQEILGITRITIEETGVPGKGARFEIRVPKGTWRFFNG
jgi:PAS domain S-box-containing protein